MRDFSDIAKPILEKLIDHPERGPPKLTSRTTMPEGSEYPDGALLPIDPRLDDFSEVVGGVTPENLDAGRRVVGEYGLDVLAFYKSFRFKAYGPFKGKWGIFITDAGLATVAASFQDKRPGLSRIEVLRVAFRTLFLHEQYHFWIDAWALAREASELTSMPLMNGFANGCVKKYEYYLELRQYLATSWFDVEESLANYYLFRALKRQKLNDGSYPTRMLAEFLDECPEPYSLYRMTTKERCFKERLLAGAVSSGLSTSHISIFGVDRLADNIGRIMAAEIGFGTSNYPISDSNACPVFVVREPQFASRVAPFQGPDLDELRRFIATYLAGSPLKKTDHEYFRIDNGERVKFPNPHQKEAIGREFKNILKKAGMLMREYTSERSKTDSWKKGCPRQTAKRSLL